MTIHSTAQIDPAAELGAGVTVGPFAVIERDVTIGEGTVIGPHACILRYTTLGKKCQIHAGAVIGDLPQDLGFKGGVSYVRIGNGTIIREHVTIHRGTEAGTSTEVGDECMIMATAHLAHNVRLANRVLVVSGALLAGYVQVDDRAFISGNVVVHQFTRIGRLAMLGGACGVSRDVPPFCTVRPQGTNELLGLNIVGLRRGGVMPEDRLSLKKAFHLWFRSGLSIRQATAEVRRQLGHCSAVMEMAEFIDATRRGICVCRGEAPAESADEATA
jgi:UDP-N-acetylglucosamine acyltransferase